MDCSVDECTNPSRTKTMCVRHYQKSLRHGTPTPDESVFKKRGRKPDPTKWRSRYNTDNPSRSRPKKEKTERTHCKHGHELTEDNRYWHLTTETWVCKKCVKEATRRYRESQGNPRDLTKCKNGHLISTDNVNLYSNGTTRCKTCVQVNMQTSRLKKYGITQEQFEELEVRQKGACAVCHQSMAGLRNLHIDHDHVTGQVRGLLCSQCNTALGKFRDSPEVLIAAAKYLMDSWIVEADKS